MIHLQAFDGVTILLQKGFFCFIDQKACQESIGSGWFAIHSTNIQIKQNVVLETGVEGPKIPTGHDDVTVSRNFLPQGNDS